MSNNVCERRKIKFYKNLKKKIYFFLDRARHKVFRDIAKTKFFDVLKLRREYVKKWRKKKGLGFAEKKRIRKVLSKRMRNKFHFKGTKNRAFVKSFLKVVKGLPIFFFLNDYCIFMPGINYVCVFRSLNEISNYEYELMYTTVLSQYN
jgi:hypothetical protein